MHFSSLRFRGFWKKQFFDNREFDKSAILYEKLFHQLNKTDEQITLPLAVLSPAEVDILKLICAEQTNKEISENLNMSVKTVENFRNKLLSKTGSKNVVGLVTFAIKKGYLIVE